MLAVLGPDATGASTEPLADAVAAAGWDWAVPVVRVGAALAAAGALLALVAGLGRTSLAMAREGDLPRWLDAVHPTYQVPHRAELSVAAVVVVHRAASWTCAARSASRRSACCSTTSSPTPRPGRRASEQRRYPRWLQVLGCAGCLVLVATLPWQSVVAGVAVFAVGVRRYGWCDCAGSPTVGAWTPQEAIDRIAAGQGAPPGTASCTRRATSTRAPSTPAPRPTALCRAGHLQGETVPVLVRWSHGSGRPDASDDMPYVRGMSVSFVLPDGTSTDLLGQTVPRFPVRTPEDFVRLTEVARDRRELAKFLATRPRTALALAANARAQALAPPKSYAEATYFPVHAYRWLTLSGHGTWVRYRLVPRPGPRPARQVHRTRAAARGDPRPARRRGRWPSTWSSPSPAAKDDPHNPMSVWRGSREFVAGWFEITTPEDDHEAEGDVVVFDPTRVVDGIELQRRPDPALPAVRLLGLHRAPHALTPRAPVP